MKPNDSNGCVGLPYHTPQPTIIMNLKVVLVHLIFSHYQVWKLTNYHTYKPSDLVMMDGELCVTI